MITPWTPDRVPSFERFNRMMDDAFGTLEEFRGAWTPSVDIKETPTELTFVAELPGLQEKDVEVTLNGDVLSIRGSRELDTEERKDDYVRIERSYGSFVRSFRLDVPVMPDEIQATFANGLLTVSVPKAETRTPKKIRVSKG
jgi:HSP20 family protein